MEATIMEGLEQKLEQKCEKNHPQRIAQRRLNEAMIESMEAVMVTNRIVRCFIMSPSTLKDQLTGKIKLID